jgi:hypothetical protein
MKLKNAITTYRLDLDELKAMFAEKLNVEAKNIDVGLITKTVYGDEWGSQNIYDERFDREEFVGVEVTVRK